MGKKNAFLDKIQKDRREERIVYQHLLTQMYFDLFTISMRENGITEDKCIAVLRSADENYGEFCDIWNKDTKDRVVSFGKLDARLRQLCPKNFVPWDERYADFEISKGV